MANVASMVAQQAMQIARDNKLISRGLNGLGGRTKNRVLRGLLKGAGGIAGQLGFSEAMGSGLTPAPTGGQSNRKKRNRRRRGARRRGAASATSGGTIVGAANAPVAFARTDELRPLFRVYPSDTEDGMVVHAVEKIGPVAFAAGGGAFAVSQFGKVGPQVSAVFPWLSNFAPLFQRYKLKFLRLHYQHFCATNVAGQVMLQYYPDPSFNNSSSAGLTQAIVDQMSNFMVGALYEDFCHTADLSGLDKSQWLDCQTASPTDDVNPNYGGLFGVYTNNAAASQTGTGNIWIEAVFEFKGRSSSSVTIGLGAIRSALHVRASRERKARVIGAICTSLLDDVEREKPKSVDMTLSTLEQSYCAVPGSPTWSSTALASATK